MPRALRVRPLVDARPSIRELAAAGAVHHLDLLVEPLEVGFQRQRSSPCENTSQIFSAIYFQEKTIHLSTTMRYHQRCHIVLRIKLLQFVSGNILQFSDSRFQKLRVFASYRH